MVLQLKSNIPFSCAYSDILVFNIEGCMSLRVIFVCSSRWSQFCTRESGSVYHNHEMKWSFKVLMSLSDALYQCIPGGSSCYLMLFSFSRFWNSGDTSLSSFMQLGFRPLVYRFPCKSWKTRMNHLSIISFMAHTRVLLMSYS